MMNMFVKSFRYFMGLKLQRKIDAGTQRSWEHRFQRIKIADNTGMGIPGNTRSPGK